MAMVQSNLLANQSSLSPIELADRAQRRLFVASVLFGVIAALIGACLALLLWRANNKYQEAVTADANARIEEAKRGAEEARRDAAAANERAEKLSLRIEEEARKRAEAEERLERIRKYVSRRAIINADPLYFGSKGSAEILFQKDHPEAFHFARQIYMNLKLAGWNITIPRPLASTESDPYLPASIAAGGNDSDVTVLARFLESEPDESNTPYATLHKFFAASKFGLHCRMEETLPPDFFRIVVGPKW